ncbi:hypothetical protein U1Q18_051135, partial [Sarracenia purpurea var. burkii]
PRICSSYKTEEQINEICRDLAVLPAFKNDIFRRPKDVDGECTDLEVHLYNETLDEKVHMTANIILCHLGLRFWKCVSASVLNTNVAEYYSTDDKHVNCYPEGQFTPARL